MAYRTIILKWAINFHLQRGVIFKTHDKNARIGLLEWRCCNFIICYQLYPHSLAVNVWEK